MFCKKKDIRIGGRRFRAVEFGYGKDVHTQDIEPDDLEDCVTQVYSPIPVCVPACVPVSMRMRKLCVRTRTYAY